MKENALKIILGVMAGVLALALAVETVLWNNDKKAYKAQIEGLQSELDECKKAADEIVTYKDEIEKYKKEIEELKKFEESKAAAEEETHNVLSTPASVDAYTAPEGEEVVENSGLPTINTEEEKEEVVEVAPAPAPAPTPSPAPAPAERDENGALTSGNLAGIPRRSGTVYYEGGEW
jgi:hypothetical protein